MSIRTKRIISALVMLVCIGAALTFFIEYNRHTKEENFIMDFINEIFTVRSVDYVTLDELAKPIDQFGIASAEKRVAEHFGKYLTEEAVQQEAIQKTVEKYNNAAAEYSFTAYSVSNFDFDRQEWLFYKISFDVEITLSDGEKESFPVEASVRLVKDENDKYKASSITLSDNDDLQSFERKEAQNPAEEETDDSAQEETQDSAQEETP